jgi:hypothetical protein
VKIQAWDIRPGDNFIEEIHGAAVVASRTIAVLSPEYLDSRYTTPEWTAAVQQSVRRRSKVCFPRRRFRRLKDG